MSKLTEFVNLNETALFRESLTKNPIPVGIPAMFEAMLRHNTIRYIVKYASLVALALSFGVDILKLF